MKRFRKKRLVALPIVGFLLSFVVSLFLFSPTHALIIDGGIVVPPGTSPSDLSDIDALKRDVGTEAVRDFFSAGTPERAIPVIRQTGVQNTSAVIRQAGGGPFGQVVRQQTNTSDLSVFINQASGNSAGGLIKGVGVTNTNTLLNQAGARIAGELLRATGLTDVVSAVNRTSGGTFGGVLRQTGAPTMSRVLTSAGGESVGRGIGLLGGNTGSLGRITGIGNEGGFLLSLANGSLGQAVGRSSGGTFANFVTSAGPSAAARTVALGIAGSETALPGITSGTILDSQSTVGALSDIFGDGGGAPGTTSGFCDTGTSPSFPDTVDTHVPVKDATLHTISRAIAGDTNALRKILKDLCDKEFVLDPQAQHEWVQVSENLVKRTINFVNKAYNDNPLYLTNPYDYFDRIKGAVVEDFYDEVVQNKNIDGDVKTLVLQGIHAHVKRPNWASAVKKSEGLRNIKAGDLSTNYEAAGGHDAEHELLSNPQNSQFLVSLAITELEKRLKEAVSYEEQQLAWGQGFFSVKTCGESLSPSIDPRDCVIRTPGSILKDHVSLVLGTALRQIEQANEYDERISAGAFTAISAVLSGSGLKDLTQEAVTGGSIGPSGLSPGAGEERVSPPPPPFQNRQLDLLQHVR